MIDSTGSMAKWIKGVKEKCQVILDKLNENPKLKSYDIKFGGIFYRDPVDEPSDIHEYQHLGTVSDLKAKMADIKAKGGNDTPEDWYGAYEIVFDQEKMKWTEESIKIIIHIADAGAHTLRFSNGDKKHNDKKYENGLVEFIQRCAREKITIFGYQIGNGPKKSFKECKAIYDAVGSRDSSYEIYPFDNLEKAEDNVIADKLERTITDGISAFMRNK